MAAVAEGLVAAPPATAQPRRLHARHHAAGTADDFHVAADLQGSVGLRIDRERPVTHRQHFSLASGRLAARDEIHLVVRAIAKRLVLRSSAAAQREAVTDRGFAIEAD